MITNKNEINGVKVLKHGLKYNGNYCPCIYSFGPLVDGREVVTIYARHHNKRIPSVLNPKNDSDGMTDYFETDSLRFDKGTEEYNIFLQLKP